MVLAHHKTLASQLYGEFRGFFPHSAVEYFVSYYDYYQPEAYVPSSDTYIEKDASVNEHIEQMRLSATKALLERSDSIIVATVSSIYGLGDPKAYLAMVLHLKRGDRLDQRSLLRLQGRREAGRLVEAQRLEQRTRFDIEMIKEVGYCAGIENYSRYLSGRAPGELPPCLFDYLPGKALLIVDESHQTIPQLGAMYRGDRSRKEVLVE